MENIDLSFLTTNTFYEYIPIESVQLLLNSDQLEKYWKNHCYANDQAKRNGYTNEHAQLLKYLTKFEKKAKINAFGVKYALSDAREGRVFPVNALGCTSFRKHVRNWLMEKAYYDVDISNAHPNILRWWCAKNNVSCDKMNDYCINRESWRKVLKAHYNTGEDEIKKLFITLCFFGSHSGWVEYNDIKSGDGSDIAIHPFVSAFKTELQNIGEAMKSLYPEKFKVIEHRKMAAYASSMKSAETQKQRDPSFDLEAAEMAAKDACQNAVGTFVSLYLQHQECGLVCRLLVALDGMHLFQHPEHKHMPKSSKNVKVLTYEFDGFKVLKVNADAFKNVYQIDLTKWCDNWIAEQITGCTPDKQYYITWEFKKIQSPLMISDECVAFTEEERNIKESVENNLQIKIDKLVAKGVFTVKEIARLHKENPWYKPGYDVVKKAFECQLSKITGNASFLIEVRDERGVIVKMREQLLKTAFVAYEQVCYWIEVEDKKEGIVRLKQMKFFDKWRTDLLQLSYDSFDNFPPDIPCPVGVKNCWVPFYYEDLHDPNHPDDPYVYDEEYITVIRDFLLLICGGENERAYCVNWIATVLQNPSVKLPILIFTGYFGCGKNSFLNVLQALVGAAKYLESSRPNRDVFGDFNGLMADPIIVGLTEMAEKKTENAVDEIKALVTDMNYVVNAKKVNQMKMQSYHKFVIVTNHPNPVSTIGERRYQAFVSSRELCNDTEYWKWFYDMLKVDSKIRSLYHYFRTFNIPAEFKKEETVVSDKVDRSDQSNECQFVSYFIYECYKTATPNTPECVTNQMLFDFYKQWKLLFFSESATVSNAWDNSQKCSKGFYHWIEQYLDMTFVSLRDKKDRFRKIDIFSLRAKYEDYMSGKLNPYSATNAKTASRKRKFDSYE